MADMISMGLHVLNIVLLLVLLWIYVQNYTKMKSKYTIGLIIFALLFLVQSAMGLYYDTSMTMYYSDPAEQAAKVLEGVKTVAFAVMLWISWE